MKMLDPCRGWCRAERMSRELGHIDSSLIVVESATHQTLLPEFTSFLRHG